MKSEIAAAADTPSIDLTPTASQTVGPFFHLGCTHHRSVGCLRKDDTPGEPISVVCELLDGDSVPVPDAMIEIWQADAAGEYDDEDAARGDQSNSRFRGFGRLATDNKGLCAFKTIRPGSAPGNNGVAMQAPHINVSVFARGILKRLCTRIYFSGNPGNDNDPILSLVPQQRRHTLLAKPDPADPSRWQFSIHLCGEYETVFFDV